LSFGTTNIIPIKSSSSERVVNFKGNDSFVKSNHADVAFGMRNVGTKAKLTLFAFLMSMFLGCVHVPDAEIDDVARILSHTDVGERFTALKGVLTGSEKSIAADGTYRLSYKDWRAGGGQKIDIVVKKDPNNPKRLIGTNTLDDGSNGVNAVVIENTSEGMIIKESFEGIDIGSQTIEITKPVEEGGLTRKFSHHPQIKEEIYPLGSDTARVVVRGNSFEVISGFGHIK
jgi:hypothetical protein